MAKLEQGDKAPDFETVDQDGKTWSLQGLANQSVVLYFYPADDTPGCTREACDFRDSHEDLKAAGYVILGVSPQGVTSHKAFASKFNLNFPLLVDEDLAMASAYGAAKEMGEFDGIPLQVSRSTFVIGPDGRITHALYGVRSRGHVDELRQSLSV